MHRARVGSLLVLFLVATAAGLSAQFPAEFRYDLGQRLRRVERAWLATDPADPSREEARESVGRAVAAFFSMNVRRVAAELDAAWLALVPQDDVSAVRAAVAPVTVRPKRRIVRLTDPWLVELVGAEDVELPRGPHRVPTRVGAVTTLGDEAQRELPGTVSIALPDVLTDGDHRVAVGLAVGPGMVAGREIWLPETAISVIREDPEELLAAAEAVLDDVSEAPDTLERESLAGLVRLLRATVRGDAHETDVPAARLFDELDAFATALRDGVSHPTDAHPGEHWLRVPVGSRALPVRLRVPEREAGDTAARPLIVALHGMGGSEHLFFDGYGDGLLIRLAAARGAYVVAPRAMPAGAAEPLVEALAARFAIDRERVFVIGHSMGAATAVAAASRFPELFAKVVAIGGGGRPTDLDELGKVPFLVAPGEHDFARPGAEALAAALKRGGVPTELRVIPGVEHMLVVAESLPAVLEWLFETGTPSGAEGKR